MFVWAPRTIRQANHKARGTESDAEIENRLNVGDTELANTPGFNLYLENHYDEATLSELNTFIEHSLTARPSENLPAPSEPEHPSAHPKVVLVYNALSEWLTRRFLPAFRAARLAVGALEFILADSLPLDAEADVFMKIFGGVMALGEAGLPLHLSARYVAETAIDAFLDKNPGNRCCYCAAGNSRCGRKNNLLDRLAAFRCGLTMRQAPGFLKKAPCLITEV